MLNGTQRVASRMSEEDIAIFGTQSVPLTSEQNLGRIVAGNLAQSTPLGKS